LRRYIIFKNKSTKQQIGEDLFYNDHGFHCILDYTIDFVLY